MEIRIISFKLYSEAAQESGPVFHGRADLLGHVHNPLPELPQQLRDKRTKYWFSILDWSTSAPVPIYISERWQGLVKMQENGAKLEEVLQVPSYSQPALHFSQNPPNLTGIYCTDSPKGWFPRHWGLHPCRLVGPGWAEPQLIWVCGMLDWMSPTVPPVIWDLGFLQLLWAELNPNHPYSCGSGIPCSSCAAVGFQPASLLC